MVGRRALALLPLVVLTACSKPEPPKIVPKEARVTAVGPAGLDLVLKVEATNPNSVSLSARSFTGRAKLDGQWEMGVVTIDKPVALPPHTPTMIEVPMKLPWTDLKALASLASAQRPVPYVVEGTVKIGGERINVEIPWSMTGTISREQIVGAALKGLQIP